MNDSAAYLNKSGKLAFVKNKCVNKVYAKEYVQKEKMEKTWSCQND